jgi:hypothetical protein
MQARQPNALTASSINFWSIGIMTIAKAAVQAAIINPTNLKQTGATINSLIETMQANPFGALCIVLVCISVALGVMCWSKRP